MASAVSDSSVLIAFSGIGRLDILGNIFKTVIIPAEVFREVVGDCPDRAREQAASTQVAEASFITVCRNSRFEAKLAELPATLGAGERGAIGLAVRLNLTLLIDDSRARKAAVFLGIQTVGSLGILARAKQEGLIPRVKPLVVGMRGNGLHLKADLLREFFYDIGEY